VFSRPFHVGGGFVQSYCLEDVVGDYGDFCLARLQHLSHEVEDGPRHAAHSILSHSPLYKLKKGLLDVGRRNLSLKNSVKRVEVEHVVSQLPQHSGRLPEEGGFAASLRAEDHHGKPGASLRPLHHLRKGAVPIHELCLDAGRDFDLDPLHASVGFKSNLSAGSHPIDGHDAPAAI
jgi:hypothetical protein